MNDRIAERARTPRYTFAQVARMIGRPADTVRRWSVGNARTYQGKPRQDEPLIAMDGERGEGLPLSFLNLLELQMLSRYRDDAALQSIRPALAYTAQEMGEERPLLTVNFKVHGGELFTRFEETEGRKLLVNATRGGQVALSQIVEEATSNIDYDHETASRLWFRSRAHPMFVDLRVAAAQPITAETGVRLDAIWSRSAEGYRAEEIAYDTGATLDEVTAALAIAA
jgi:hypothetical protein